MPEHDGPAKPAIADTGNEAGEGLGRVDRVDEHAFGPRDKAGCFLRGGRRRAISTAELLPVDLDGVVVESRVEVRQWREAAGDAGNRRPGLASGGRHGDTQHRGLPTGNPETRPHAGVRATGRG